MVNITQLKQSILFSLKCSNEKNIFSIKKIIFFIFLIQYIGLYLYMYIWYIVRINILYCLLINHYFFLVMK